MHANKAVMARIHTATSPRAANHSRTVAEGRNPIARATRITIIVATRFRRTLATTWPASTVAEMIGRVRNRRMAPRVMSRFTEMATEAAPKPAQVRITPGTTKST